MKYIISCLLIILAFSSYMALTTDYRFKSAEGKSQPAIKESVPPVTVEIAPEPPPEIPPTESENSEIDDEYSDAEEIPADDPADLPDYSTGNSIETEIADVFGAESRIALAVAKAESGLNPKAINRNRDGSRDMGIFQINDRHGWSDEERLDWRTNIRIAKELYDSRGWNEWAVYNNGTYRNYL